MSFQSVITLIRRLGRGFRYGFTICYTLWCLESNIRLQHYLLSSGFDGIKLPYSCRSNIYIRQMKSNVYDALHQSDLALNLLYALIDINSCHPAVYITHRTSLSNYWHGVPHITTRPSEYCLACSPLYDFKSCRVTQQPIVVCYWVYSVQVSQLQNRQAFKATFHYNVRLYKYGNSHYI